RKLGLSAKKPNLTAWKKLIDKLKAKKSKQIEITIVGKYFGTGEYQLKDSYAALFDAIDHAACQAGVDVKTRWVDAQKVEKEGVTLIGKPDGIIVPIGWGERGAQGMIAAASYARKNMIPYLGLCYGMQLATIAYARDILKWKDANSEENSKTTKHPVIHLMPAQKEIMARRAYGGTMRLGTWEAIVKKGTLAYEIYDKYNGFIDKRSGLTAERHRHRYEFNDDFFKNFEKAGLVISARSKIENLAEIIELPKAVHPFYLGTQGHPEYKSRPLSPHPIFMAFVEACKKKESN
ncbi:MAG: CTP synthase, partial [Candidatus Levybacteria bacterium]|nr:CTP synthase [Candidatus Levybacteria bacterium]